MENVKTYWICILLTVVFVLTLKCCSNNCNENTHSTNKIIEEITDTITKVDTLIKTKTIVRNKEVEKLVPYQHIVYVPSYKLCEDTTKIDSLKTLCFMQSKVIKTDDSLFVLFNKKDSLYAKKDSIKDKYIDSLITAPNKYWKGFKHGAEVGIGAGVIIGVTIKK